MNNKTAKSILREWFKTGILWCLTDDTPFMNLLRMTGREIGVPVQDVFRFCLSPKDFLVEKIHKNSLGKKKILLIERNLRESGGTINLMKEMKTEFPDGYLVGISATPSDAMKMLMKETGCQGIIEKPTDIDSVVILLADIVRPPTAEELLVQKARNDIENGDIDSGKHIVGKLIKSRPDEPENYLLLGDVFRAEGEREKAKTVYSVAAKKDEMYLEPLQRVVEMAVEDGDDKTALESLEKMDKISPLNGERKVEMAKVAMRSGDVEKAAKCLEQAGRYLDSASRDEVREISLKLAETTSDDPIIAEKNARRCLELKEGKFGPEDAHAFNVLGMALRKQGRYSDAIKEYRKALKIIPDSPELLYNAGLAFAENFDKGSAQKAMLKAYDLGLCQVAPAGVCVNIGKMLYLAGEMQKAEKCFLFALKKIPGLQQAKDGLQWISEWREKWKVETC